MPKQNQSKTQPDKYQLTLDIGGKTYMSYGDTLLEAINSLPKPEFIKTRSVLKVECGEKKLTRGLNILQLRRLLGKDFVRQVQAKQLERFMR